MFIAEQYYPGHDPFVLTGSYRPDYNDPKIPIWFKWSPHGDIRQFQFQGLTTKTDWAAPRLTGS